jgi:hypothetical protein
MFVQAEYWSDDKLREIGKASESEGGCKHPNETRVESRQLTFVFT